MKLGKLCVLAGLALAVLLAGATMATAQDNNGGGKKGGMRGPSIEQLKTDLKLTDEQVPKVQAVLDDTRKKMQALRDDSALSQDDRRAKMTTIREEQTKKMKEILKPDQFEKYQAMRPAGGKRGSGEKKAN
jgi:Spy/CpxP family protein refolding chaperone